MFELPDLPYGYAALEPVISETTLRTHHGKHHARYVQSANALLEPGDQDAPLEDIVARARRRGATALYNNAAQALNHGFYWSSMAQPDAHPDRTPPDVFAGLRAAFLEAGARHFCSGWIWLTSRGGEVSVVDTHDGDSLFRVEGHTPLLVCDVWEHAYYLDHRNDRAAYLAGWWDRLADWSFAERQHQASVGRGEAWRYPTRAADRIAAAAGG